MILIAMSVLIFAAITAAAYAVSLHVAAEKSPVAVRLRQLRTTHAGGTAAGYENAPPLLLKLLADLGGFMPASDGRNALRTGLVRAGYRGDEAPLVFLGTKLLLAFLLPVAWLAVAYATAHPIGNALITTILLVAVGFYLPSLWLWLRQRRRHDEILAALPDSLDLMVVCVEAGLGMGAALQRVGGEIRIASPALSEELSLVNQQMQTGISRTEALRNLAERSGVEDVYALVAMLIQTDRLGTSVAASLRAHADSMRTRRRQRAEQLARKAGVKLAFPLVFLILPALLVVILGPAGIQLMKALLSQE